MNKWQEYRVKDIARRIGSGGTPSSNVERYYSSDDYHWINTGDFNNNEIYGGKQMVSNAAIKEISTLRFYPVDTILVAMYGASIGKVGLLKVKATVNQACCAIVPNHKIISPYFLFYLFINYKEELQKESFGGTQPNVSQAIIANTVFNIPSLPDQRRIVDYLDAKTGAIDRRMELLGKKQDAYVRLKAATINRAVTRGLDEHVKMKDSGVEWIGRIPEHWEVKRFKSIFTECKAVSTTGQEDLLSVSEYYGIARRVDKMEEGEYESRAESLIGYKICQKNDLVINIMLAWKRGLGVSDYDGIVSPSYAVYRGNKNVVPHFFHYLMRTDKYVAEYKRNSKGIIDSRLRLYTDRFNNIMAIVPPLSEQQAIASYLDERCAKIDAAIAVVDKQVDALRRLKRALINEVVTGRRTVPILDE